MAREMRQAWGINLNSPEGHEFVGVYYFERKPPECISGIKTCTFSTREIAREHLKKVKKSWPQARVERLTININGVPENE